jgi:hypothetical protein
VRLGGEATTGDDILIGLANPMTSWMLPLRGDECFVDLPDGGEAMQFGEGYFDHRDVFTRHALEVLGR